MKWLRAFFFNDSYSVKRATALLAVAAVASNGLGLLRNLIFYRLLTLEDLDVYLASFRIPDLVFNILILGAVSSAIIPILGKVLAKDKAEGTWLATNQIISWFTVIFSGIAVLLAIAMPWLISWLTPGFSVDQQSSVILLSRLLLLQSVFFAWSFTIGCMLNTMKRFSSYALAPLIYNTSLIIGGVIAAKTTITALVWAVVIGAFLHFYIQYREARKAGFRMQINLSLSPAVREVFLLMIPRSGALAVSQIVLTYYTYLGSRMPTGSIAIFSGMNDLQTTPTVIIANSLAAAFFPTLTSHITAKDWGEMNALLQKVVRIALYLLIPSVLLALVLRAQVVRLYFGIGGADWDLTAIAIQTFVAFLIGIIPASLVAILSRVYYSFNNTRTPLVLSTIAALAGAGSAWYGVEKLGAGVAMLALGVSITAWVQCILYFIDLRRQEHVQIGMLQLAEYLGKYMFGGALIGLVSWVGLYGVDMFYGAIGWELGTHTVLGLFIQLCIAATLGVVSYLGYSRLTSQTELTWLKRSVFTRGS